MLALDFESSGIDATSCFAVTVALARILPGEGAAMQLWMLQPPAGLAIPEQASAIHGISTDRALSEGKPRELVFSEVRTAVVDWLRRGQPLVAFNASYDITLLECELVRCGLPTVASELGEIRPVIDPYVIDKHVSYRKGSRKLVDQCNHYDVRIDGAHDAGHDALAAARVAWRIAQRNERIAARTLDQLHDDQVQWAAAQAASFREYLTKQGKPADDVDGTWPVRVKSAAVPA